MKCAYCGEKADSFDHVPPRNFTGVKSCKQKRTKKDGVPSCTECNVLLGAKCLLTIGGRAEYLAKKFKKRYWRVLESVDWEPQELDGLGYNMRESVLGTMRVKREINARIKYCEVIALISPSKADIWEEVEYDDGIPDE